MIPVLVPRMALSLLLASAAGIAAADPGQPAAASPVATWQLLTIVGYLGMLSLLSFIGVRWWKTRQGSPSGILRSRQINVVEVRRVSPSTSILLADIKGHSYVIVCSGSAVAIQPLPEAQP